MRRIRQRRRSAARPNDALIAIVFSAAALETFINEMAHLANERFALPPGSRVVIEDPSVERFATKVLKIESKRGSTTSKFQAASTNLAGKPFAEDEQPYFDLALLFDLRNDIMHGHEDRFPGIPFARHGDLILADPPLIAVRLADRGLTLGVRSGGMGPYVRWLDSPSVAQWACDAAAATVQSVLAMVPGAVRPSDDPLDDVPSTWPLRDALKMWYGEAFSPVPLVDAPPLPEYDYRDQ